MPPAGPRLGLPLRRNLFEKRFLDLQKLLFNKKFFGVQGRFFKKAPGRRRHREKKLDAVLDYNHDTNYNTNHAAQTVR